MFYILMNIKIFNANKKEIEDKKYNVFIGISMGIKPMNKELAKKYINWALKHTRNKVIILIADTIAKINYEVFSGYNKSKSHKRALKEGEIHIKFFKEILSEFSKEKRDKIKILRWDDIFSNRLKNMSNILEKEFARNKGFKKKILYFVEEYSKRRGKKLSANKLNYLAKYMFFELPTMFEGIEFNNTKYELLFYPTFVDGGMSKMILGIRNNKIFPELKDKLNLVGKTVLVEAYVDK